ncbi:ornithine decarboxylase [Escherichia coli]|uniref:Ornithine decarboxylase n=1 Tax=Escherichia coli TaxID=562 RepID=A0A376RDJ6_ECOLX|nr:ornithine decarboxylase [Escherichia coli]
MVMNPQDAHSAYIRGEVELCGFVMPKGELRQKGRCLIHPGVLCVVPGEVWGGAVQRYFLALEEGVNLLPGFSPELQGVIAKPMRMA